MSEESKILRKVLNAGNDLTVLSEAERTEYYLLYCEQHGVNPLTQPFSWLRSKDKEGKDKVTLYANKNFSEQIRAKLKIKFQAPKIEITDEGKQLQGFVMFELPDGRIEFATAAVPLVKEEWAWDTSKNRNTKTGKIVPLLPDERANAFMRLETKLKNRATLSVAGSGVIDESELDTMKSITIETSHQPLEELKAKVESKKEEPNGNGSKSKFSVSKEKYKEWLEASKPTKASLLGQEVSKEAFYMHNSFQNEFEDLLKVKPSEKKEDGNRYWIPV